MIRTFKGYNLIVIVSMLFMAYVASYFLFFKQIPFRIYNSDIYHEISVIKEFRSESIGDSFFNEGPVDLHAGPYYYLLHLISKATHLSDYNLMLVAALVNIVFLFWALYFFARSFRVPPDAALLFMYISMFGWGTFMFFFAGLYDFTNLLATGSLPATMGIAMILLILGLQKRALKNKSTRLLVINSLLSGFLIVSHLLSGVILCSFVCLLALEDALIHKRLRRINIYMILTIPISVALSFLWPYFNIITLVTSSQTVQVGATDQVKENYFEISYWKSILGLSLLGIIFLPRLIREKRYFIATLLVCSAIMTASYLLPVRVSLYWRYFPFIFLGVSLALSLYIVKMNRWALGIFLVLFFASGLMYSKQRLDLVLRNNVIERNEYEEVMKFIPENSIIMSDPNTSYHLAALHDVKVVAVPYNHANPAYIPESKERYDEGYIFLTSSTSTVETQEEFLKKYKADFVLIDEKYIPDYVRFGHDRSWLSNFNLLVQHELIFENDHMKLFKLK
jgi:hypothetical protein